MIKKFLLLASLAGVFAFASCDNEGDDKKKEPISVETSAVTEIAFTYAKGNGIVSGDYEVTERGVCWSTTEGPTTSDNKQAARAAGTGEFDVNITGLDTETKYYVRAYAVSEGNTIYGNEIDFSTKAAPAITVTTGTAEDVFSMGATIETTINIAGSIDVTERGVCWGTSETPTIDDNKTVSEGTENIFAVKITGLTPETKYYARGYVTTELGTTYSTLDTEFTTTALAFFAGNSYMMTISFGTGMAGFYFYQPWPGDPLPTYEAAVWDEVDDIVTASSVTADGVRMTREFGVTFGKDTQGRPVAAYYVGYHLDDIKNTIYREYYYTRIELTSNASFKVVQQPSTHPAIWTTLLANNTIAAYMESMFENEMSIVPYGIGQPDAPFAGYEMWIGESNDSYWNSPSFTHIAAVDAATYFGN